MHFHRSRDVWVPPGFVVPIPVGESGLTKGQARGLRWRRTGRNRYVPAQVDASTPEQRIVEALGHLPDGGALTGWAVLRLHGARYLDGRARDGSRRPVQLVVGPGNGRRPRAGVQFLYDRLEPVTTVRGLPCQPVERALFDEMRSSKRLFDAVTAIDMAVLAGLATVPRMSEYVAGHARWNGVPLVRKALGLADAHSASPPEVRLRLLWQVSMRLPRPLVNVGVFDRSERFVGYPDLLDVVSGLVIEYDGVDHLPEERRSKDVDREGELRDLGLEVIHVVSRDMRHPQQLTARLAKARARARWEPEEARKWILEPKRPRYCPTSCSCRLERPWGR